MPILIYTWGGSQAPGTTKFKHPSSAFERYNPSPKYCTSAHKTGRHGRRSRCIAAIALPLHCRRCIAAAALPPEPRRRRARTITAQRPIPLLLRAVRTACLHRRSHEAPGAGSLDVTRSTPAAGCANALRCADSLHAGDSHAAPPRRERPAGLAPSARSCLYPRGGRGSGWGRDAGADGASRRLRHRRPPAGTATAPQPRQCTSAAATHPRHASTGAQRTPARGGGGVIS